LIDKALLCDAESIDGAGLYVNIVVAVQRKVDKLKK
jgi:hypothetical protein